MYLDLHEKSRTTEFVVHELDVRLVFKPIECRQVSVRVRVPFAQDQLLLSHTDPRCLALLNDCQVRKIMRVRQHLLGP